jgi:NADH:ubiquinone oxidoreductase subunit
VQLKRFLLELFTWWNNATLGTRFYTWRKGELVGEDEFGNRYYRHRQPGFPLRERRWVIYQGEAEPTRIPPGWYGWMHHRTDVPPPREEFRPREWMKRHQPNLTGTPLAYRPAGSLASSRERPKTTYYQPWTPDSGNERALPGRGAAEPKG